MGNLMGNMAHLKEVVNFISGVGVLGTPIKLIKNGGYLIKFLYLENLNVRED